MGEGKGVGCAMTQPGRLTHLFFSLHNLQKNRVTIEVSIPQEYHRSVVGGQGRNVRKASLK